MPEQHRAADAHDEAGHRRRDRCGHPPPRGLQAAQAALDALHARRQETHAALLAATRDQPDRDRLTGGASVQHIEQLGRDLAELDKRIQAATQEWENSRRPYSAAVAASLASMRRSAVDAAITAISELVAALGILDRINREISRSDGTAVRFPALYRNAVGALRARLQQQLPN